MTSQPASDQGHWARGDEGEAFPVKAGTVWQVGNHTLSCSDLMATQLFDGLVESAGPTLVYCDPPWGQGLVNSFRTKAGLGPATYRWEQLYRRIANLGHSRFLPVWLEGSKIESRDGQKIFASMRGPAPRWDHYWPIEYASHSPAGLYYSGPGQYPEVLTDQLTGKHDRDTPALVMAAYAPTGVVVEPCCGLGGTPLNAERIGWASVCNEINPFRMSSSLVQLAKATGRDPVQVR
jgi:hypothetical protein